DRARPGATFLLNSPFGPEEAWDRLPREVQAQISDKGLDVWVIAADQVARDTGMGNRINRVMAPGFFHLSGVLPSDEAIAHIKASVEKAYGNRGRTVVERNFAAIDAAVAELHRLEVPATAEGERTMAVTVPDDAPDFVKHVTSMLMA